MNAFEHWKLRGPVRMVRSEFAEWDIVQEGWQAPRRSTLVQFRDDGDITEIEDHNPNGSISRSNFSHDKHARLLEAIFQLDDGPISRRVCHYDDFGRLV